MDLTCLKQFQLGPHEAEAKYSRSPARQKLLRWKLNVKKTQRRGRPIVLETGTVKNELSRNSRGSVSDSRRPLVKVGGPRSYGWRDMPNKILIPLQSFLSCFLESPANRWVAVGAIEGLWRGYSLVCPKGTICWAPVAVTQALGGSSVLILLCAKNQANEN